MVMVMIFMMRGNDLLWHSPALQKEAGRRKYESEEQREELVPMLREVSRQEYLKKREDAKLEELKDELEDAKYLFDGEGEGGERATYRTVSW